MHNASKRLFVVFSYDQDAPAQIPNRNPRLAGSLAAKRGPQLPNLPSDYWLYNKGDPSAGAICLPFSQLLC